MFRTRTHLILFCLAFIASPTLFAQSPSEYPPDHPINTRCLPDSPCLSFPSELIRIDQNLQNQIAQRGIAWGPRLDKIRWITEDPQGILTLVILGLLLFVACHRFYRPRFWPTLVSFFFALLSLGISDLTSSALKVFFGRLKPHVAFYNPNVLPALSFPSNHAFNSVVFFALALIFLRPLSERFAHSKSIFVGAIGTLVLYVGYTRVLFGQHYPLDILAGFSFGSIYALMLAALWQQLLPRLEKSKFWRP